MLWPREGGKNAGEGGWPRLIARQILAVTRIMLTPGRLNATATQAATPCFAAS